MININNRKIAAIILAAGRGSRMKAKKKNKVTITIADKPIILHAIHLLEKMHLALIVVVVGFAKKSVMSLIENPAIIFADQHKRLGTAHAVKSALPKLPPDITDVLVIQGDDAYFYKPETLEKLLQMHQTTNAAFSLLTITVDNPLGLGRIVRNENGQVIGSVEEKEANEEQLKIKEINPACYVFQVSFLKKYLPKVTKSAITGEYYLPNLINIAIKNNEKIETVNAGLLPWRGVNTKEELEEAEKLYSQINN